MTILRLVGGSDVKPTAAPATPHDALASSQTSFRVIDDRPSTETLSTTAKNGRLRKKRFEAWRTADAVTRYWRARLEFHEALSFAQRRGISEGRSHPAADDEDRQALVNGWRAAWVMQLLTPAPDGASVKWKQDALARGKYEYIPA